MRVLTLWGREDTALTKKGPCAGRGAAGRMEDQAAPGSGGGDEPPGPTKMNAKRSGRSSEEETRNKTKLVSEPGDGRGGEASWCFPVGSLGWRGMRPGWGAAGFSGRV